LAPTREYHGHTDSVRALAEVSGGRFASGSRDYTIRIWAVASGACLATLEGHTSLVYALASTDEHTLVSSGLEETLRVWDMRSYGCVGVIASGLVALTLVRLAHGGVASTHQDNVVRLWDVRRCERAGELSFSCNWVRCVALRSDGHLVSVCSDETVRVWDVAARVCVGVARVCSMVHAMPAGEGCLVVGCEDGRVLVLGFPWDRRGLAVVGWVAVRAGLRLGRE